VPTDATTTVLQALDAAQRQLAAALWISGGMVAACLMIGLLAAGWRRAALTAGFVYAVTLSFVPVGHARVLGPCGAAAAAIGLVRPNGANDAQGGRKRP